MTHGTHPPYTVDNRYVYSAIREFDFGKIKIGLPPININDDIVIYILNILGGDPSCIKKYAKELSLGFRVNFGTNIDGFVAPEGKSIPLVYELASMCRIPYVILRKSYKPYMGTKIIKADVRTITTNNNEELYLDNKDMIYITNKRLLFVDDVVSSGASLNACQKIVNATHGKIIGCTAMAVEGDYIPDIPSYFLCRLPIIKLEEKKENK